MPFTVDFLDGAVIEWDAGGDSRRIESYTPALYVSAETAAELRSVRPFVDEQPPVVETACEEWQTVWRKEPEPVLRVTVADLQAVTDVAGEIRGWGAPGTYKLYNVDFSREFRYCLETRTDPTPPSGTSLSVCELGLAPKPRNDGDITPLTLDGTAIEGGPRAVLERVAATLRNVDPDVLVLESAEIVPLLFETADRHDLADFAMGRLDGFQTLAGRSTYESYGRVGHSPARYNVPGRAIIDRSNSFFWSQTTLGGLLDLVKRSRKPVQELAWASIGNVLTAIQIREALESGVLVPWNSWRHEQFKPMTTLHDADRGGFIFAPEVGFHEGVHELDFASLYPSIMITRNISPDTIRCACHGDREDVPGLGYSICDEAGFLGRVLDPLVSDRAAYKAELDATDDPDREAELRGRAEALKWILVSCFGYQGFSNAKFGRIECHEAINAFAREILLETKAILEAHGWEIVHGIVDSVWVRPIPDATRTPLADVATEITEAIGIPLEHEAEYEWIAFVPRADSDAGALNRYFAKVRGADTFKKRGIELRQRSTPAFVADCQADYLRVLDDTRSPEAVCDRLRAHLARLRTGGVDPSALVITRRVSKPLDEYQQATRNVAALERADHQAFRVAPGESVRFVVVDDEKTSQARVQLAHEDIDTYDESFYATQLIRAAESVTAPLGWRRDRIRQHLAETDAAPLTAFS